MGPHNRGHRSWLGMLPRDWKRQSSFACVTGTCGPQLCAQPGLGLLESLPLAPRGSSRVRPCGTGGHKTQQTSRSLCPVTKDGKAWGRIPLRQPPCSATGVGIGGRAARTRSCQAVETAGQVHPHKPVTSSKASGSVLRGQAM